MSKQNKAEPKPEPKASLEARVALLEKQVAHIVRMTGVQGINELGDEGEELPPSGGGGGEERP